MPALRLVLIGAGGHASSQHAPALLDHERNHPGSVSVVGVCDRNHERAHALAAPFAASVHDDWQRCLDELRPDAVLACVPPALTPPIARAAAARNVAIWMEKPLAPSLDEAKALVADLDAAKARVMVSMNRRFDPGLLALRRHMAGRVPLLLRGILARERRSEAQFLTETGVHMVDQIIELTGMPRSALHHHRQDCNGSARFHLGWVAENGCAIELDIAPTLGRNSEAIEVIGAGWRGSFRSSWFDSGDIEWHEADREPQRERTDPQEPVWKRNGTAAETAAFLAACAGSGPWHPSPSAVLVATSLCHQAIG